jgi:hypothetical protein
VALRGYLRFPDSPGCGDTVVPLVEISTPLPHHSLAPFKCPLFSIEYLPESFQPLFISQKSHDIGDDNRSNASLILAIYEFKPLLHPSCPTSWIYGLAFWILHGMSILTMTMNLLIVLWILSKSPQFEISRGLPTPSFLLVDLSTTTIFLNTHVRRSSG